MQFLNCPVCGRPMAEEPHKSEFHFHCSFCDRDYLYEEGTLIDLGSPGGAKPPTPELPGKK